MLSKEEIEKAKENFNFFNEGDYITKEMNESATILKEHIEQLKRMKQKEENMKGESNEQSR